MSIKFDVVIVNWNSGGLVKQCVESILNSNFSNCQLNQVIVVDNDSKDSSADILNNDSRLVVIKNKNNLGFGKACNIGSKICGGDYIIFINPDVIVNNDTFNSLFSYVNSNGENNIGVYGIQLEYSNGTIQNSCARFPTFYKILTRTIGIDKLNSFFKSYRMTDFDHMKNREVDHVMGAFYVIKRDIFNKLKGFDEDYFVYFEDIDLSKRVNNLGFKSQYISNSKAIHIGCGTTENIKGLRYYYNVYGRLIYAKKHLNYLSFFFLYLTAISIEINIRIFMLILKGNFYDIKELLSGYLLILKNVSLKVSK